MAHSGEPWENKIIRWSNQRSLVGINSICPPMQRTKTQYNLCGVPTKGTTWIWSKKKHQFSLCPTLPCLFLSKKKKHHHQLDPRWGPTFNISHILYKTVKDTKDKKKWGHILDWKRMTWWLNKAHFLRWTATRKIWIGSIKWTSVINADFQTWRADCGFTRMSLFLRNTMKYVGVIGHHYLQLHKSLQKRRMIMNMWLV